MPLTDGAGSHNTGAWSVSSRPLYGNAIMSRGSYALVYIYIIEQYHLYGGI